MSGRVRLGAFEFDPTTGDLTRDDDSGAPSRLAPKPTALLALLIDKRGELATRDEIRERLWPDVAVEFDTNLHHCVRQVREAFGESAKTATYILNVPRRGYRLGPTVDPKPVVASPPSAPAEAPSPAAPRRSNAANEPANGEAARADGPPAGEAKAKPPARARPQSPETGRANVDQPPPRRRRSAWAVVAALALPAVVTSAVSLQPDPVVSRLAIMPFATDEMPATVAGESQRAGARILVELAETYGEAMDVIGPRTTGPLRRSGLSLPEISDKLGVTYILNAKFLGTTDAPEVLVELIRSSDGRHVWVRRFEGLDAQDADTIAAGVTSKLGAPGA